MMIYLEKKMLCNSNYYTVQGWMVNDLGLKGDELTVFAILWGFSQDGATVSRTPKQYFMAWTGKGKDATIATINSLLEKGLIERVDIKGQTPEYRCKKRPVEKSDLSENQTGVVEILHLDPSKNPTPINNNNINNKAQYAHAQEISNKLFDEWFTLYGGHTGRGGCWSYWNTLIPEEQAQVISHTKRYKEKAVTPLQPYDYLVRFQYWRDEKPKEQRDKATENNLTGMCTVREGGEYKNVTKAYAEEKGLKIITDYDNRTDQ